MFIFYQFSGTPAGSSDLSKIAWIVYGFMLSMSLWPHGWIPSGPMKQVVEFV